MEANKASAGQTQSNRSDYEPLVHVGIILKDPLDHFHENEPYTVSLLFWSKHKLHCITPLRCLPDIYHDYLQYVYKWTYNKTWENVAT